MKHIMGLTAAAVLLVSRPLVAAPKPDVILHDGKIFTANPSQPWAEAVAIRGNKIIAVGTNASVEALASDSTRKIHLGGRLVIPGLNDAHVHVPLDPDGFHIDTGAFIPGPGPDLTSVLQLVEEAAAVTPPGTWIFGVVGTAVIENPDANRYAIDAVAPNHPVRLAVWAGHGTIINTAAMNVAGIAENEPDPFAGTYERDGSGIVTGVLHEYAETRLRRALTMNVPVASARAQLLNFANVVSQFGVTTIQNIPFGLTQARVDEVLDGVELPVRIRTICFPLTPDESCKTRLTDRKEDMVYASGIKWITDGSPIERYAALRAPYADKPGWTGVFNFPGDPLAAIVERSLQGNREQDQLVIHGVGDRAIDNILNTIQSSGSAQVWRKRRVRLEHGDLVQPEHIPVMKAYQTILVQNPLHLALPDLLGERFGPERMANIQPLRSVIEAGVPLAFGSDTVTGPGNPFWDLFFATIHPTRPSEAVTLEQAVTAYTRGSAFAEYTDAVKGSLEAGKLADLAVLSQDIFTVPPPAILGTVSVMTMVDGKVVYDAGVVH